MADSEYVSDAIKAGFTREQAEFLEGNVPGHSHELEDVDGLPEALGELGLSEDEEDEEDEEEAD